MPSFFYIVCSNKEFVIFVLYSKDSYLKQGDCLYSSLCIPNHYGCHELSLPRIVLSRIVRHELSCHELSCHELSCHELSVFPVNALYIKLKFKILSLL